MDYSVQSLHRLPVLNYDISLNDKAPKSDRNFVRYTKDNKKNRSRRKRIIDVGSKPSNKNNKAKEQKYQLRRQSAKLKDIKRKLSVCSNYIRGLVHPINTLQDPKNKKQNNISKPSNEIKVLFSSNTHKKNKRKKINQDLINDIYDLEGNFVYNNFKEEFNESHNILNCEVPKKSKQSIYKSFALSDFKCNNLRYSSSTPSYGCNIPTHYKVVNFPKYDVADVELEEININRGLYLNNCQCQTENEIIIQKDEKDAEIQSNTQRGGGDCPTVSNPCELKEVCIKTEQPKNESNPKQDYCPDGRLFRMLYNPIMLHENAISIAQGALKFTIFALALIVWSPCIVALFFCWVVTYPLRPKQIYLGSRCKSQSVENKNLRGSKNTRDNSIQTCQDNNIWSPFTKGINWALNSIALSFGVFKSLLHLGKNDPGMKRKGRYGNKHCVMTSHPKNKYTLYYSRNKGWVMKSTQRNKRDNCSKCSKKMVKTVASEPCTEFPNRYAIIGGNSCNKPRKACARRCQSYPGKPRLCKCQLVESFLPCRCHHRHRHLCMNTCGLPVHNNPVHHKANLKRCTYSKASLYQTRKPVLFQQRICKPLNQDPPITFRCKLYRYCKEAACNINRVIDNVETGICRNGTYFCDTYGITLREKPCFFVYKSCPALYPFSLATYKLCANVCHFLLLFIFGCIWSPLLGFCYLCYATFCKAF